MFQRWKLMALAILSVTCTQGQAFERLDDNEIYNDDDYLYPGWFCEVCRNPAEHPEDYAAFAYNAYFGEAAWAFGAELGIPFRVYNHEAKWVVIWFDDFLWDGVSLLPNTMDIRIRLETGEIVTITVLQGGPDLPVGEETSGTTDPCSCDGGGGESEGEEDNSEDADEAEEDYHWEEPEYEGSVEIVDPDENGDFPEWDEEI